MTPIINRKSPIVNRQRRIFFAAMLLMALSCLFAVTVRGANLCVGSSSSGSGNGSDWNNLLQWSSFTPVRGNTYYLADGSYGGKTLDVAASGTTLITIKKAVVGDATVEAITGWSSTLGDGQAAFTGQITIQTHYWILDGSKRDESDWWDESAYGIKITRSGHSNIGIEAAVNGQIRVNEISISNLAIILPYFNGSGAAKAISTDNGSDPLIVSSNMVISRVLARGGNQHFFIRHTSDSTIEYCASELTGGSGDFHGQNINLYYNPDRTTVRWNKFRDSFTTHGSGGTGIVSIQHTDGHRIYGNIFIRCYTSDGLGYIGNNGSDIHVYNNTWVDCTGNRDITLNTSGGNANVARNNLWINSGSPNVYVATASDNTTSGSTSIFVDYDAEDFRLASNTAAGFTLSSPYDTDMLGHTRGGDGQDWSRGAFQFYIEEEPEPPSGLSVWNVGTLTIQP